MIYFKLEGHDWKYPVEDVCRLFFGSDKGVYEDSVPPENYRGIFIFSRVAYVENKPCVETLLYSDGVKVNEYRSVLGASYTDKFDPTRKVRREIKRQVYMCLSGFLDRKLPWGTLTGIRPAKIVQEMINQGEARDQILTSLKEYYLVSEPKAQLAYEVAVNERPILKRSFENMVGLYIGIPFCPSRCLYCSFTSNPIGRYSVFITKYLDALKEEIRGTSEILNEHGLKVQSIYIGGGTPTAISAPDLQKLLCMVEESFDLKYLEEYTIEAGRPDSLDHEKLRIIKNSRADRISINPQTMNDETLRLVGRNHTSEDIIKAYYMARELGINNINMDLIIGLPGETFEMFMHTLEEIKKLGPENLTVHSMAIKRASRLKDEIDNFRLTDPIEAGEMVNLALKFARDMGMHPYYMYRQKNITGDLENIGYCIPGFESVYNVQIMEEKQTIIALGAGAITKAVFPEENRIERAANVKSLEEYIKRTNEMIMRKRALLEHLRIKQ